MSDFPQPCVETCDEIAFYAELVCELDEELNEALGLIGDYRSREAGVAAVLDHIYALLAIVGGSAFFAGVLFGVYLW